LILTLKTLITFFIFFSCACGDNTLDSSENSSYLQPEIRQVDVYYEVFCDHRNQFLIASFDQSTGFPINMEFDRGTCGSQTQCVPDVTFDPLPCRD
jgi:hypothetical protein